MDSPVTPDDQTAAALYTEYRRGIDAGLIGGLAASSGPTLRPLIGTADLIPQSHARPADSQTQADSQAGHTGSLARPGQQAQRVDQHAHDDHHDERQLTDPSRQE